MQLCHFVLSDVTLCPEDTYTYLSESHATTSWLDHVLCTHSGHQLIENIDVLYDVISSDHHPILLNINFPCNIVELDDIDSGSNCKIKWDLLSDKDIALYMNNTELALNSVNIDHSLILCDNPSCKDPYHISAIGRFYDDIVYSLKQASECLYPKEKKPYTCIPGWGEYCKQAHHEARQAYITWRANGKPRQGDSFNAMQQSRSYFKYVVRKCKQDKNRATADKLAEKLLGKSDKLFWSEIKKMNRGNTPVVSTVNGVTGSKNIAEMWKKHFETLLNSSKNVDKKNEVLDAVSGVNSNNCYFVRFSVDEIKDGFKNIKNGKTCGLDSIYGEHLKYAHPRLQVLLSLLFNCIVIHGHIPVALMDTLLVPLAKDKNGNLSDKDNYRPLAITCIMS